MTNEIKAALNINYIKENFDITLGRNSEDEYFVSLYIKDTVFERAGEKCIKNKNINDFKRQLVDFLIFYLDKKIYQISP